MGEFNIDVNSFGPGKDKLIDMTKFGERGHMLHK